ncbi:MAG: class I SAM-dependent methyltransferase [Betaproteobacteria bacterium]
MSSTLLRRSMSRVARCLWDRDDATSRIRDRLVAEPWFVDRLSVCGLTVSVEGWSFPQSNPAGFFLNDRPFEKIGYPLARADVGAAFPQRRNAVMSGFHCQSADVTHAYPDGMMKVSRSGDEEAIDSGRNTWFLPDASLHPDLPVDARRFRVIGNSDATGFLHTGATDFHRLDRIVRKISGQSLWDFDNVLDWGVGCGRLARHFPVERRKALSGCDIDHDNVAWCAANLDGHFVRSSLEPPLPFAGDTFDVIYGVSVFTHLKEALQDRWLAELRRVTRVGGLVLATVHGETAVDFLRLPLAQYRELRAVIARQGLVVSSANRQLDGHVERPEEYVNVFHHRDYVARRWSANFEVLHVIPGYLFTHDLVVMRRTS